jgi:hypothetical protein
MAWKLPENGRLVLISVVPHCTQLWVISSRSFDSAPLGYRAGAAAVIAIRCPQCGQGSMRGKQNEHRTTVKELCYKSWLMRRMPYLDDKV